MDSYKLLLLNNYLSKRKFLGGDEPSKEDDVVFTETQSFLKNECKGQTPKALSHLAKWLNTVASFPEETRKSWPGFELTISQCVVRWPETFVRQMLDEIDSLLLASSVTAVEYSRKQIMLNRGTLHFSAKNENVVFKHFISDLYAVLDHLVVLLYCHYQRNGEPDFSHSILDIKFPFYDNVEYPASNDVPKDVESALKKRRDELVAEIVSKIFGSTDDAHDHFGKTVLSLQPSNLVAKNGDKSPKRVEDGSDQQVFSQLYFLSHYRSHHGLISISPEPKYFTTSYPPMEINPNDPQFDECAVKNSMSRAMFVFCPDDIRAASEEKAWSLKPITIMAERFLHFVKLFRDDVLGRYFSIPAFDVVYKVRGEYDGGLRINNHFIAWEEQGLHRPIPI